MLLIFLKFFVLTFLLSASPPFFPLLACFSVPAYLRLPGLWVQSGRYRPVVWFCSRSSSMRRPAERQPASHQLQRWSDCFLFFFFLVCTSHWTNDALSPHAQFQRCGDLMCAFGQTPTVKWECFIRKPEIRGCKGSLQIFFCHEKDDKSEQGGLLSSILKYREPSSIHRLCHRSFTHLQLLTVSEVGHRSASDSVLGLDWRSLSAQFVKDTLDLFSLYGRHQCD